MAFSFGKKGVNDGVTVGTGKIFLLRIRTIKKTPTETAATKRNINLSVITVSAINIKALLWPSVLHIPVL